MWKIIRMAMAYKHLMPDIIELVKLIESTGKDGKLTTKERGKLISAFSQYLKKVGPGSANATSGSTSDARATAKSN